MAEVTVSVCTNFRSHPENRFLVQGSLTPHFPLWIDVDDGLTSFSVPEPSAEEITSLTLKWTEDGLFRMVYELCDECAESEEENPTFN